MLRAFVALNDILGRDSKRTHGDPIPSRVVKTDPIQLVARRVQIYMELMTCLHLSSSRVAVFPEVHHSEAADRNDAPSVVG